MPTMNLGENRILSSDGSKEYIDGFEIKNLLRHVGILGSSGSGKTVMAKVILEECALAGIPSIIIDIQGDLARLGMEPQNDEKSDSERQNTWSDKTDVRVWTPLTEDGLPICLDPFEPPNTSKDSELIAAWDRLAIGLTNLLGNDVSKPKGSQVKAFLYNHMTSLAEKGEAPYDFGELAESIRKVDPKEVEGIISASALKELGRNAEANNSGSDALLYSLGTPLNIDVMMKERITGKTPVNVLYLNTLPNEAMKQAFIQQLCRKLYDWMLENPSGDKLQCILFLDEAGPFMPPDPRNPAAKDGLRLMLKQGRKYGIGCIIASQSPGDLDYRTLGQASTMFLGRFTQDQEISKIDQMISNAPDPKAITANLPSLGPGEFELFSPDASNEVIHLRTRWLLTPHGSPLTNKDLPALTPKSMREWAAGYIKRPPKRIKTPSWKQRQGEPVGGKPELMHSFPTLGGAEDPMQVLLSTTNLLSIITLFITTYFLGQSYIDGELNIAWMIIGGVISLLLAVLLSLSYLLKGEGELASKVRLRSRGFEWIILGWIWSVWIIHKVDFVDLGWVYFPVMISQTLLTVFVILEYIHKLRLAKISFGGESLLRRFDNIRSSLTDVEIKSAKSSSEELMNRFGLLTTTLTLGLIANLLLTGEDLSSGLLREIGVRLVTLEGAFLLSSVISILKANK